MMNISAPDLIVVMLGFTKSELEPLLVSQYSIHLNCIMYFFLVIFLILEYISQPFSVQIIVLAMEFCPIPLCHISLHMVLTLR